MSSLTFSALRTTVAARHPSEAREADFLSASQLLRELDETT